MEIWWQRRMYLWWSVGLLLNCMPGASYSRQFRSLLCLCNIFQVLINSLFVDTGFRVVLKEEWCFGQGIINLECIKGTGLERKKVILKDRWSPIRASVVLAFSASVTFVAVITFSPQGPRWIWWSFPLWTQPPGDWHCAPRGWRKMRRSLQQKN